MHGDDGGRRGALTGLLAWSGGLWWTYMDPEVLLKTEARYSSEVQQPAPAITDVGHPQHTAHAGLQLAEQEHAGSYGSEGWGFESLRARPAQKPIAIL
jgi:hypothetical protein